MAISVRVLLVIVLAFVGMAVAANSALLTRARIDSGCTTALTAHGTVLEECHSGWFKGYPNLLDKGCTAVGVAPGRQLWSCPKAP